MFLKKLTTAVSSKYKPKSNEESSEAVRQNTVIWIDSNATQKDEKTQSLIAKLHAISEDCICIADLDGCNEHLRNKSIQRCFIIISGSLGQDFVKRFHSLSMIHSIYIYCFNQKLHEQWSKSWDKIQGVYTRIDPICHSLRRVIELSDSPDFTMSLLYLNEDEKTVHLERLEPQFIYTNILKETIYEIEYNLEESKRNMVEIFRKKYCGDDQQLQFIDEYEKTYTSNDVIKWYTRESFLYRSVNMALRNCEGDIIVDMGFFIKDLHVALEKLHQEQYSESTGDSFRLFRGQALKKDDFLKLKENIGGLWSFSCFLSTSTDVVVSRSFAFDSAKNEGCVGILFILVIDPNNKSVPYADIQHHSVFPRESEILFSMHSIFRITTVERIEPDKEIYEVVLKQTNNDDPQWKRLQESLNAKFKGSGLCRLGFILEEMNYLEKSENIYNQLLDCALHDIDRAHFYHQLGLIQWKRRNYDASIRFYQKAIDLKSEANIVDELAVADSYNNLGQVYYSKRQLASAISFYNDALNFRKKNLSENHLDIATSYNNIALVYYDLRDYSKALSYHQQAIRIKKKILPDMHPSLAVSYVNLSWVFTVQRNFSEAIHFLEKALHIRKTVLLPQHKDVIEVENLIKKVKERAESLKDD